MISISEPFSISALNKANIDLQAKCVRRRVRCVKYYYFCATRDKDAKCKTCYLIVGLIILKTGPFSLIVVFGLVIMVYEPLYNNYPTSRALFGSFLSPIRVQTDKI